MTLRLPDYGGGCITGIVPALLDGVDAPWMPEVARRATQVVLLVLDGLGWEQLQERRSLVPAMASMEGGPITSVAPTTTATALSSIVHGAAPAVHGVVGYRVRVGIGGGAVLNVLRWRTADGDAREAVPPQAFQSRPGFGGRRVPVVTRSEFAGTGFTTALGLDGAIVGWRRPSAIAVEVGRCLAAGAPLVYAYYDGVDTVAHELGFGPHYDAEVVAADRIVADLAAVLPPGAALVVTSDHGQVEVGDRLVLLDDEVLGDVAMTSGEGRFLWLHAAPGRAGALEATCRQRFEASGQAWVRTRREVIDEGWFGGPLTPSWEERLGDVALVAIEPVAFLDPADQGSAGLRCRHGSLTPAELLVPLLAVGSLA